MAHVHATSLDAIVADAVRQVVGRTSKDIAAKIAALAAAELEKQLAAAKRPARKLPRRPARSRSRPRVEITRWAADKRARRVPTFVIELTGGLDTKKKIVAKYGDGVTFEKGKPAPRPKLAA